MAIEDRAKIWAQQVVQLHSLPVPDYLRPRKNKLLKQAEFIKKSLEATDPLRPMQPVAAELGFLPLIIGGGLVAVAAMSKWAKDAFEISKESERFDQLVKGGLTAAQAQAVLNQTSFNWKMAAIPVGILVAGLIVYKVVSNGNR